MEYMVNKTQLAQYILTNYFKLREKNISPIKFQKSMYFTYVYWAKSFIHLNEQYKEDDEDRNKPLFEQSFKAWSYGPVDEDVKEIYDNEKVNMLSEEEYQTFRENNKIVVEFLDGMLPQIYNTGDFSLVDLTHQDECWKSKYDDTVPYSDSYMDTDEIIYEYTRKQ